MKKSVAILVACILSSCLWGQSEPARTQSGRLTGQSRFPLNEYKELEPHSLPDPEQWKDVRGVNASWGDIDMRYDKTSVPVFTVTEDLILNGWRGERVFAQAVVWTSVTVDDLNYEITDLRGPGGQVIHSECIKSGFVRYLLGDTFFSNGTGCGKWAEEPVMDSVLVADCIDHHAMSLELAPMRTQGIWLTCHIPDDIAPGQYDGQLIIRNGRKIVRKLELSINADVRVLPKPEDWKFHLDLWQNPYAVARYYQVEPWSDQHLQAMRPLMEMLAQAGQKVITTTLIHKPWGGQTEDHFESMVEWIRKSDGTWEYKFDIFDKWVEFMMSCGITEQISCFTMAPWNMSFRYFDETSGSFQDLKADVGTPEYDEFWAGMLKVFVEHLKAKGWYERCAIAMDERPMEVMREVIKVIRKVSPDFKIALAGNYHPEIETEIYDYCIAYKQHFPADVLSRRKVEGKISTYYTCCAELAPNLFTISEPGDGLLLGLEMAKRQSDGYLRWAYNSWPLEPLLDSRFSAFTSGDTFLVYPGARSSIRFERLIQGIQEYEKLRILSERAPISVIPQPLSIVESEGGVDVTGAAYMMPSDLDEKSADVIHGFMGQLGRQSSSMCIQTRSPKRALFRFEKDAAMKNEAYRLQVDASGVSVAASSFNGFLYALQTIRQLLPVQIYEKTPATGISWTLPFVKIYDEPEFSYRGMHMDSARHFWEVGQVKKYLDIMALHKMNVFHWHLTDDQGWRVEIKKYPKLTQVGSKRSGTALGKGWYDVEYDDIPYGGYYTQDEIREVVAYAAGMGIEVIPEIDLPGHMLAALASYPELGCTGGPYHVWGRWGVSPDVLCAGKESTYVFLQDILLEIMDLFPSEYIHIGGDECPKTRWCSCTECRTKMTQLGLDPDEKESAERLQGYMTKRIETFLASHGRRIIGWDEILAGDILPTTTIMSWRGTDGGIAASKAGHDVIMTPNTHLYLDYYQSRKIQDEPFAIGGFINTEKVYSFEPFTDEMTEQQRSHILGVQANLWTEYIKTPEHQEYMLLPRMSALSEVQWCPAENKDYSRFLDKMTGMARIYQTLGYNYAKHIFEVNPVIGVNVEKGCPQVTLTVQGGTPMYYTLDGSQPTTTSSLYTGPVDISEGQVFKAVVVRDDMPTKTFTQTFAGHKAMGRPVVMNTAPYPLYSVGLPGSLVNGVLNESQDAAAGEWVAWRGDPVDVIIDMGGVAYSKVSVRSFVSKWEDMYAPLALSAAVSEDGKEYVELAREEYQIEEEKVPDGIKSYDLEFAPTTARYLRVVIKTVPALPDWSERTGKPAYLFIDEIKVE